MGSKDEFAGPRRRGTWLLLFAGFCSVVGWVSTSLLLLTGYTNSRHFATLSATVLTVARSLLFTSFIVVLAVVFLGWGLRRLKGIRGQARDVLIATTLFPSILLFPVLRYVGIGVIMLTPFCIAHARAAVLGPRIVQSARSPDDTCEAYVIDRPSIDGPNHHLYVRDSRQHETEVAALPEDVDFNKAIRWSPHGDVVVFRTHFSLIGYRVADGRKAEVTLGGERHWRKNGTFWVDYAAAKRLGEIAFPEPGSFRFRLEGTDLWQAVDFEGDRE
jgi:hypothetical protein